MKRKHDNRDHAIATGTRIFLGVAAAAAVLLFIRSIPDLIRYVKMERM